MKHKDIYKEEYIPLEVGVLFGPTFISNDFEIIKNKNGSPIIRSINDSPNDLSYIRIDENTLYNGVIKYGRLLYDVLKDNLVPINIMKIHSNKPINILYWNDSIESKLNAIRDICFDYLNEYGFPISYNDDSTKDLVDFIKKDSYNVANIIDIIRPLLVTFMLDQSILYLAKIKNKFPEIYDCLFQNVSLNNKDILGAIVKYINSNSGFIHKQSKYNVKIIPDKNQEFYIPVRSVTNMFTFVFEKLTNIVCTLVTKEESDYQPSTYIVLRKCQRCLNNIEVDEKTISRTNKAVPTTKRYLCDNCKNELNKKARKISDNNYESKLRELYDSIKSRVLESHDEKIISEFKKLGYRGKSSLKTLNNFKDTYL